VVDLKINLKTRDVVRDQTLAHNEIVTRDVPPDPGVAKLVDQAKTKSAPIANRKIGTIAADLPAAGGPSGESPLGDVIADAQLEGTQSNGAQIAITNPGGIRADLTYASSSNGKGDGVVTYGEAFAVQPFANIMQTITMTGVNIKNVLEQQWQATATRILQISKSLHYTYTLLAPVGSRISNITVNGTPIDPAVRTACGEQLPRLRWGRVHRVHQGHQPVGWPDRPRRIHRLLRGASRCRAAGGGPHHGRPVVHRSWLCERSFSAVAN
jgi:5'-nucleotidase